MKKKGQLGNLMSLAIGIAVLAITLTVTFLVIDQGEEQAGAVEGLDFSNETECATSLTCNATNTLTEAVDDIPGWIPLIVIAVIGAVLLSLVAMFKKGGR